MHSTHQELLQRPLHPPPITIILMITGLVHLSGEIRDQNLIVQHTIIVGRKRQQVKGERGFMDAAPSVGNLHHLNIMQNIHFAFKLFFISSSRSLFWVVVINWSSTCNSLTFHLQLLDCLKSQKRTTTTSVIFSRTASISRGCCDVLPTLAISGCTTSFVCEFHSGVTNPVHGEWRRRVK